MVSADNETKKPGDICLKMDDGDSRKWTCLAQVREWQEQRVRIALDKAMMAASKKDARAGENGYGLNVRVLDREQMVWEQAMDTDCTPKRSTEANKPSLSELSCRVKRLSQRYDELKKK